MLTSEERTILDDYKNAFHKYRRYKKIVDFDESLLKKLSYFLIRIEDALPQIQFSLPPHRYSQFVIAFFTKGNGEVLIRNVKVQITKQTLIIIPGQTLTSGSHSPDTRGYVLIFNLNFFLKANFPSQHLKRMDLFRAELIPYVYTGLNHGKTLQSIFEKILDERQHERINKNEMISLKILELLIVCERLFKKGQQLAKQTMPLVVVEYIELIQNHFTENHTVKFYAQKLFVHPNILNVLCKRYLLQSAKLTIDLKLISEAESLLQHTTQTVKEIAYELGFQSSSHFFRFFKRHTGRSPAQYRQFHLNL
jgi:AraC-like DNA-binding protein